MSYRVSVPLLVREQARAGARDLVLEILRKNWPDLQAAARATKKGVTFVVRVNADSEGEAKHKARYWLRRATNKSRGALRWTGQTAGEIKVAPWT